MVYSEDFNKKDFVDPKNPNKKSGTGFINQLKMRVDKQDKEISDLKERCYHLEQYFRAEKPEYRWNKADITFIDMTTEEFTDICVKKYSYEAKNRNGNVVHINKGAVKYLREKE